MGYNRAQVSIQLHLLLSFNLQFSLSLVLSHHYLTKVKVHSFITSVHLNELIAFDFLHSTHVVVLFRTIESVKSLGAVVFWLNRVIELLFTIFIRRLLLLHLWM